MPVDNKGNCSNCGTGYFKYNNINACLCSHIAEAEVATEKRIIKLLEDLYLKRDSDGNVLDTKHNEDLLYVIALIKGEK